MNNKEGFSWSARGRSFKYAFKGIKKLLGDEHNSRIHFCVMICVIAAGFLLGINAMEWCMVVLCIGGVFAAECFNSAVEAVCDKVSPAHDELIGKAKDIAAAGVLLFVIASVVVGVIVFMPKILSLFAS